MPARLRGGWKAFVEATTGRQPAASFLLAAADTAGHTMRYRVYGLRTPGSYDAAAAADLGPSISS